MRMGVAAIFAKERHPEGAENVEGSHAGCDDADPVHPRRVSVSSAQNRILAEVAGSERETGDRERSGQKYPESHRRVFFQTAHVPHVLLAMAGVNHAAGTQ